MDTVLVISALEERLRDHQDRVSSASQMSVETLCMLILALRRRNGAPQVPLTALLLSLQLRDGSWPAVSETESDGCWVTAFGAIVLMATGHTEDRLAAAIQWLTRASGREANWFWQWKFRTVDTSVQFDPSKFGWSWIPGTTSWVIPTAFSLIALQQFGRLGHPTPQNLRWRIDLGIQMLMDRECPGGGWNAGNAVAFSVPYSPYIDATAIALLALRPHDSDRPVQESLAWLQKQLPECRSALSLAWGILALTAFRKSRPEVVKSLGAAVASLGVFIERHEVPDESVTLATSLLAMEAASTGQHVFEVYP